MTTEAEAHRAAMIRVLAGPRHAEAAERLIRDGATVDAARVCLRNRVRESLRENPPPLRYVTDDQFLAMLKRDL